MIVSIHRTRERSKSKGLVVLAVFLGLTCSLLPSLVLAQTQSHPLSEITPMDVNFNLIGMNITNVNYIFFGNGSIDTYLYRSSTGILGLTNSLLVSNWVNASSFNASNQICLGGVCKSSWPSSLVGGSGTATQVAFWSASDTLSSDSNLYWDNTNKGLGIGTSTIASGTKLNVSGGNVSIDSNTLFVDSTNDRVGIGTTAPASKLHISTSGSSTVINASNGTVNTGLYIGTLAGGQAGASIGTDSDHQFRLFTVGIDRLTIDTSGKVGIGTTSPVKTLDVVGDINATGIYYAGSSGIQLTNTTGYLKTAALDAAILSTPMSSDLDMNSYNITKADYVFFGTDNGINLYRSAADILKTDDSFIVAGDWLNGTSINASNQICLGGICKTTWPAGTVTSVTATGGLTGNPNPITSSGSIWIASEGVNETHLASSVAGNGLTGGAGSALAVGAGTAISIAADSVSVSYNTTAMTTDANSKLTLTDAYMTGSAYDSRFLNVGESHTHAAGDITSGTLSNARLNSNLAWINNSQIWTAAQTSMTINSLILGGNMDANSKSITAADWMNATNLNASTAIYGQTIYEGGTALSSKYGSSSHTHDAANITSGTLSNVRLDTNIYWINSSTGLSASNISSGNLAIARMPTGGAWSLTSDLNINSNTLVVDQDASRVGIGTAAPSTALDVSGGDIEINDGAATGTNKIKGNRIFYAGDETEVTTTSTSYTLKKQFTAIFDDTYGIKPTYVNVIAMLKNSDGNQTSLNVTLLGCASNLNWNTTSTTYTLIKGSIDVSACGNGNYTTNIYLKTNSSTGTAYNNVIEFYLVG